MYFNMQEGDVEKTSFGRTKREVYEKCKDHIDALLAIDEDMTYEDFILSMVFYTFDVRDNKKMLAKNKGYRGLTANSATAASADAEPPLRRRKAKRASLQAPSSLIIP